MLEKVDLSLLPIDENLLAIEISVHCTSLLFTDRLGERVHWHWGMGDSACNEWLLTAVGVEELRHGQIVLWMLSLTLQVLHWLRRPDRRGRVCE